MEMGEQGGMVGNWDGAQLPARIIVKLSAVVGHAELSAQADINHYIACQPDHNGASF
jgi:hypothetical protein